MLRDYTEKLYLNTDYDLYSSHSIRENVVLYNPVKGIEHTNEIINRCYGSNFTFVKIENLTRTEIRDLALQSKVYIDFGHHPGKDRIPREMAACGCIVITGNEGTAQSDIDVPIGPRKFKMVDGKYNYESIKSQIESDMNNYMAGFLDEHQIKYRMDIKSEKSIVYSDVKNMVNVIDSDIL